ncbi:MAG: M48 family metalloprotease [Alphaproteobacteria bacterium]|nr:M48 family metalloprotease [Alphaproteobacteria bacterium]
MAQVNFSDQKFFEGFRFYDINSRMQSKISAKIKEVFARLFQGTDINLDDFYFLGYDDTQANAFKSQKKVDGKTVIAVSYGLIQKLTRIEEFAAIIAHECGHVIWADLIGGDNTIIQERSADIHSVDMMINAGYNPRYVTVAQKKIFGNFSNSEVTFNVHGSSYQRIEDVKAYMTKIASEQGDFPDITNDKPDTDWLNFQKELEQIYKEDGYDTFLDKELKKKFGQKYVLNLNRLEVLKFFLECIKTHPEWFDQEHEVRIKDLVKKLYEYNYSVKSEEETVVLQDIFLALRDKYSIHLDELLRHFKLEMFGPFKEQYENIKNLIKYCYDKEKATEYANKIASLLWTVYFVKDVNWPEIKVEPLGKDNIGKMLPWDQLKSYKVHNIDYIFEYCFQTEYAAKAHYSKIVNFKSEDYFLDENKIVTAYGEEAHLLYKDKEKLEIEKEIQKNIDFFEVILQLIELTVSYYKGEISRSKYVDLYANIAEEKKLEYELQHNFSIYKASKYIYIGAKSNLEEKMEKYGISYDAFFDFYEKIKQTSFYKEFILTSPEIQYEPERLYTKSLNYILERIRVTLNPANYSKFNEFIMQSLLKEADDISKDDEYYGRTKYQELIETYVHPTTIFESHFIEGNLADKMIFRDKLRDAHKKTEKYKEDFNQEVIKHAIKNSRVVVDLPVFLAEKVKSELLENRPSEIISTMMRTIGIMNMPKNQKELEQSLLLCQNNRKEYPSAEYYKLMFILWAEYLKNGYKCNPIDLFKYFKPTYTEKNEYVYTEIQDIFGTYINFSNLSLMDKITLYEFMDTNKLFSEKIANKNSLIRTIVNETIQNDNQEFVVNKIVEPLLARHPVTEYGFLADRDLDFANEREKLIDFYAKYWTKILGRDDGSDNYLERVKTCVEHITQVEKVLNKRNVYIDKRLFSQMIAQSVLNKISDNVIAQEKAAKLFASGGKLRVNSEKINDYDYYGRGAEAAFSKLAQTPQKALKTIRFLNKKLTDESVKIFLESVLENTESKVDNVINKQSLTMIHENFWSADLPIRAYVMNKLLDAYTTNDKTKLELVINTYFNDDSEYYKDAFIVLESVYNNLQDYEKNLILSALLSSGQNEDNSSISNGQQVGRGLKMFFQTKGGAFVKFGQLLSYLPTLDSDIRKELATLREKANLPTRDELYEMFKTSLPESEFNKISYVGKILGGGSIYVSVHVKYDNQDCVIALMRPYTRELMSGGIDMISRSINDMAKKDKKFEVLKNIVTQAKLSCESEIDVQQDYDKYCRAVKIYENLTVHTTNADYSPYVERWIGYGADEGKNNAYKIMEMAQGESLISDAIDEEDKHDMAVGYVALELAILLSGATWDTDRHMGQQNFYNKDFRDFCIGIFDTGAQMSNKPGIKDKIMLGHLFYELIREARNGKDISDVLNSNVQQLDSMGKKYGFDTAYIDGVQRGLIALSDIIEYQKEIKDEDGKIIQERKVLTEKDLQNIIIALINSGIINKTVMRTIRTKVILNKLKILRPGWFKTLSEGFSKTQSNIRIEYIGTEPEISRMDILRKAKEEIEKLMALRESKKHLGIDRDIFITPSDESGRN